MDKKKGVIIREVSLICFGVIGAILWGIFPPVLDPLQTPHYNPSELFMRIHLALPYIGIIPLLLISLMSMGRLRKILKGGKS